MGIKTALVLGPDELENGTLVVKDLQTFEQKAVARNELKSIIA